MKRRKTVVLSEYDKYSYQEFEIKKRGKKTRIVFEFSELERAEEFIEILKKSFQNN